MTVSLWNELSDTMGTIYDAALDFSKWPLALEQIADHIGASVACLVRHDLATADGEMLMVRTDPLFARLYSDYYARLNVFAERARNQPPQTCVTDRMFLSKEELFRTEFFDGFMRPQGVHTLLNVYLLAERECGTRIAFARAPRHGEWERAQIDMLQLFAPHVHRAALLNRQLASARFGEAGSLNYLDILPQAIFLVDKDIRVLFANPAAERLIADGDGLALENGCLEAGEATGKIRRMVGEASIGGTSGSTDCALTVARRSSQNPYRLLVAPTPAKRSWFFMPSASAMVIAYDPNGAISTATTMLSRQYGLTRAEAATLGWIGRGVGLAAAASAAGVSTTTARTHLQRVFEKTGTRRQAELVRLVTQHAVAPALEPPRSEDQVHAST